METKSTDRDKRMVVLVIDDDPVIRLFASDFIADSGFEALEAADANEAVQILESRGDIHAIFTDIDMPGSTGGLKLAHAVRDRWPPIHIIITSALAANREMPVGSHFSMKTYDPDHILAMLRDIAALGRVQ